MPDLSVSVVIPTYNRSHYVVRAIDSALSQLKPGDEIIVVDDGSTDDTESALSPYREKIRYIKTTNGGAGAARNRGVREARCSLVAFLDSDDEWMDHKIDIQRNFMEINPDVLFCFSDFAITSGKDCSVERHYLPHWHKDSRSWEEILGEGHQYSSFAKLPENMDDFQVYIGDLSTSEILSSYVLTSSMMARREEAGEALHFAEDVATWEDFECFGRLSLKGLSAYFDVETAWQHGAADDRLSGIIDYRRAYANITILERVWGTNEKFLQEHGPLYEKAIKDAKIWLLRDLVLTGQLSEARKTLKEIENAPFVLRVLSFVPPAMTRGLISLKNSMR